MTGTRKVGGSIPIEATIRSYPFPNVELNSTAVGLLIKALNPALLQVGGGGGFFLAESNQL